MPSISQYFGAIAGIRPVLANRGTLAPPAAASPYMPQHGVVNSLLGVVVAATLKTVLSVTGRGALTWLGLRHSDTTSRTGRLRVTIDGNVVYDATHAAAAVSQRAAIAHGAVGDGQTSSAVSVPIEGVPLLYESSLLIEFASSLSEDSKTVVGYITYSR